jgi:hypothetical protein
MQADYLHQTSLRTALWLIGLQVICVILATLPEPAICVYGLAGLQVIAAAILFTSVQRTQRTSTPPTDLSGIADRDLPALTVAIPARNETDDLAECLESLIASTYPKLEILVLDDCSQNRHTSEIIRQFAQNGVRFVAGEMPPKNWLAKNYAYHQLAEAANSDLLLFCGVDVRFEPQTLTQLVKILLLKQKSMLSVMPKNILAAEHHFSSLIAQTNRYTWEVALPRRSFNRPPVLSTCWLVTRDLLKASGGFEAVHRGVLQERYFARQAVHHADSYSFLHSDASIGLTTHKRYEAQRGTAVRTRYPQLHRRPELVALVSLLEANLLFAPPLFMVLALLLGAWPLIALSILSCLLLGATYFRVARLGYQRNFWATAILFIPAVVYDIWTLNYSMWQYEFHEVLWKGRNVCVPVMRAISQLPTLPTPGSAQKS